MPFTTRKIPPPPAAAAWFKIHEVADRIGRAHRVFTAVRDDKLPVDLTAEWGAPVRRHRGGHLDLLTPLPGTAGVDLSALLWPETAAGAGNPVSP